MRVGRDFAKFRCQEMSIYMKSLIVIGEISCQADFYVASEKVIVYLTRENTLKFFFASLLSTQLIIIQRQNFNNNIT